MSLLRPAHRPRHARTSKARQVATAAAVATGATALVGAAASPASADDRSFSSMLSSLRGCESGGNYGANTGNGYYGAYQFDARTWRGVGGAGLPHQNSAAVQDEMATRLYEQRGWSPWPSCSRKLGLHAAAVERPGVAPVGAVDAVRAAAGGISVDGWAFDRDVQPAATDVHVYVDGRGAANLRADRARPDVAAAHGVGQGTGYAATFAAAPGRHEVCLIAIDQGGGGNALLGCRTVDVAAQPIGNLEAVQQVAGGVRVVGWTLDADTPERATDTHFYVDGRGAANVPADEPRPDVAAAFGVPEARGFDVVLPAGTEVCGIAIDTTGQTHNHLLDCRAPA